MRTLVVVLALALAVGVLTPMAAAAQVQLCPPVGAGPMLTDEQLVEMAMTCSLGLSKDQISALKAQGLSNGDIVMAYAIAAKACVPVKDVIAQFSSCNKDWNAVLAKYNVTLGDLNSCSLMTSSDVESFNRTFIAQYYGIGDADIVALRNSGVPWGDVYLLANASVRTSQPVGQLAALRSQGMSWTDIGSRFNTRLADLIRPVQMRTTSAQALSGSGPMVCPVAMYDCSGNILLSYDQATNFYTRGYDWMDVAIAANVSNYSGIPIQNPMERVRQGALWDDLLVRYGVAPSLAYNVSQYPFPRTSVYSRSMQQSRWNSIEKYQCPTGSFAQPVACPVACPPAAPAGAGPCPVPCPAAAETGPCPVHAPAACPPPCSAPACPPVYD